MTRDQMLRRMAAGKSLLEEGSPFSTYFLPRLAGLADEAAASLCERVDEVETARLRTVRETLLSVRGLVESDVAQCEAALSEDE